MNKFKTILTLVIVIVLVVIGTIMIANKNNNSEVKIVKFSTAATTGAVYPLGASICNLWNEKIEGIQASAQASNGGVANLNYIQSGEAQIGVAVTSILNESYNGTGQFEGRANKDLRVIAGLYYNPNQVVVSKDSKINNLKDIVGKRFAPGAPGGTTEVETNLHMTALGLKYLEDIKAQFVGPTEAIDLMRNKQIDGAWIMAGIPTSSVTEMTSTTNAKLISIPKETIVKLQETYPWYVEYTIPAGTYSGQDEDILTSAIKLTICTSATLDNDTVYDLTKTFWENIEELKTSNPSLNNITIENATTDLAGVPVHDGAMKYYNEVKDNKEV